MPSAKKQKEITFRIVKIRKVHHFQHDPDELEIDTQKLKEPVNFHINMAVKVNAQIGVALRANIVFFVKKKDKEINIFGIELEYQFEIVDFPKLFPIKNNEITLPEHLLINFAGYVISGARGMLAASNTIPEYSHILLPPIDPKAVLLQKKPKLMKQK